MDNLENVTFLLERVVNDDMHDLCNKIEKNDESSDGNVYMIEGKNNKYVAKVYDDRQHAKSMVCLHELLSTKLSIPKILYTNVNDDFYHGDKYIVIYSFMEGKPINQTMKEGKVDLSVIIQIAKIVRKMHDLGMNENLFNLPNLPFEKVNKRKTNLHFDLTKSNIFMNQEGIISVIDFDDAMYGSAIYDIAILISTFFFSKSRGIDLEGMNTFLDAYYGEDEKTKKEETLLIKECAIQWIDFLLSNHKLPESLIDSFQTKKRLIEDIL